MKKLLGEYSYSIVKMLIYQLAIGIFGAMISMATFAMKNDMLSLVVGVLSVLFYLFLLYTMTWEIGAKDRISVDVGKKPYRPYMGFLLSLIANIPNFVITAISLLSIGLYLLGAGEGFYSAFVILNFIFRLFLGPYLGVIQWMTESFSLSVEVRYFVDNALFFVLPTITVLIAHFAFTMGINEKTIFSTYKKKK